VVHRQKKRESDGGYRKIISSWYVILRVGNLGEEKSSVFN
jgi:hypothetical protein